jgi:hypothetical protein
MVSSIYTPNKRIGYYQDLSRALMPKQISAYNPNIRNPYAQTASTNLANVLRGLVDTYSAQQQLGKAEQLEAEQLAAQRAIGGQLAQMRTPGTGPTLDITETAMPISDMDMVQRRQQQVRRRPFSVDAPQFTPEQMAAAGTTPELLQGRIAGIRAGREKAYTARQEAEIDRRLGSIAAAIAITGEGPERERLQRQRSQLLAIKDAAQTAVRQETRETARAKEERQEERGLDVLVDVFDIELGRNRKVTKREMRLNPDNFVKAKSDEKKPTKYEANIRSLVRGGMSKKAAEDIAFGRVKVVFDPVTKQPFLFNLADETSTPLAQEMTQKPKPRPQKRKTGTLWGMVGEGPPVTGIIAGMQIAGEEVFGQVPGLSGEIASKDQIRNETAINAAKNQLIRALSINPRFPVGEMERLAKEIDVAPSIWVGTGALLEKMKGVDDYLRGRLQNELAASRDIALPSETRKNARTAAKDIKNFLDKLGVPQPGGETSDDLSKLSDDELLRQLGVRR